MTRREGIIVFLLSVSVLAMAGRWSSLQNGAANFSGIAAPRIAGLIVQMRGSSRLAFTASGAIALAGALCWGLPVQRIGPVRWKSADSAM